MQSIVSQMDEDIQKLVQEMQGSVTLAVLIWQGLKLGRLIAVRVIEAIILERVQEASPDLHCESCGNRLESKGQLKRQLVTIVGIIEWKRQVKRCPSGCKKSQVVPLDQELGLSPNQRTGPHLKRMACSLAVFVPFEIAATLLCLLTGVEVSSSSIWNWVQEAGERAMNRLQTQLDALASGAEVALEHMSDELKSLTMLVGADGVMAPFRPNKGTAQGRTVWREVKVGIVARWQTVTLNGKQTGRLMQRRVTAYLGHIDDFKPRLWLLACQRWRTRLLGRLLSAFPTRDCGHPRLLSCLSESVESRCRLDGWPHSPGSFLVSAGPPQPQTWPCSPCSTPTSRYYSATI